VKYKILMLVLVIDLAILFYSAFFGYIPEFLPYGDPTSYRILYIHIPLAWNMYFAFTLTMVCSLLYLLKENPKYDVIAFCSAVLGVLYGGGGIVTGMIWASEVWKAAWSWDPRQTTTLIALLSYIGYAALRMSIADVEKARAISSVYGVAAYITIPLSYISSMAFRSLHTQLPHQPLGIEAYGLLAFKVLTSFALFIAILNFYYSSLKVGRG